MDQEQENTLVIPEGTTSIKPGEFESCGMTKVVLPNSVTTIGDHAFRYCHNLESIVIPDSVTSIGKGAFFECKSLKQVTLPKGLTRIEDHTFELCDSLKDVTIPDGVTWIGDFAFCETCRDGKVYIPDSVTHIGTYNFMYETYPMSRMSILAEIWLNHKSYADRYYLRNFPHEKYCLHYLPEK